MSSFSSGFIFGANSDQLEDKNKTKVDLPVKNQEKKKVLPDTIQVEVKPIKIFLILNGFLEDSEARTLSVSTDNWSELRVLNPPVQGKIVNKREGYESRLEKKSDRKFKISSINYLS